MTEAEKRRVQAKQKRISREKSRLKAIFKNLDKNTLNFVDKLIGQAAYLYVSIDELQKKVDAEGYETEYQNGEFQKGVKQSESVKTLTSWHKNYLAIISKLIEYVPPGEKEKSKLAAMRDDE